MGAGPGEHEVRQDDGREHSVVDETSWLPVAEPVGHVTPHGRPDLRGHCGSRLRPILLRATASVKMGGRGRGIAIAAANGGGPV